MQYNTKVAIAAATTLLVSAAHINTAFADTAQAECLDSPSRVIVDDTESFTIDALKKVDFIDDTESFMIDALRQDCNVGCDYAPYGNIDGGQPGT